MSNVERVHSWLLSERGDSSLTLPLLYDDIVGYCCLLATYRHALSIERVAELRDKLLTAGRLLTARGDWSFSLRDLEPVWIWGEPSAGDYVAVYVLTDRGDQGFEVVASAGGAPSVVRVSDADGLTRALDRLGAESDD